MQVGAARWAALSAIARAQVLDTWRGVDGWTVARRLVVPVLVCWAGVSVTGWSWQAATVLLVALALPARFTWPAAALLVTVAVVPAATPAVVAVPVTAYAAARRIAPTRRTAIVFVLATAGFIGNGAVWLVLSGQPPGLGSALLVVIGAAVLVVLPGAVGALAGERTRRVEALRERNAILERANQLGAAQARFQERARIAGEMHDLIGHRLSLITLHAGALELQTRRSDPALSERVALLRATSHTALDELRGVLGILKVETPEPGADGHDDTTGIRADLEDLVEASVRAGLPVRLTWTGDDLADADAPIRRALHRAVREALTNVHRHAAGAPTEVSVDHGRGQVRVQIRSARPARRDDPTRGTGLGLIGLQERFRLAGGTLNAGPEGHHFVVTGILPTQAPATIDQAAMADRQTPALAGPGEGFSHSHPTSLGRNTTMRKSTKILMSILAGVLVLCGVGGVLGTWWLTHQVRQRIVPAASYEALYNGRTETQVRDAIGAQRLLARGDIDGGEPKVPAGAHCAYAYSSHTAGGGTRLVYRFCFASGALVEKREFEPTNEGATNQP
jgi:signal transduction histidine kinase